MSPILAQGTNQALLDTMVLCRALSDRANSPVAGTADISRALRWYEKTRRRRLCVVSWVTRGRCPSANQYWDRQP
jgi:FAD-dependent urate hydroxylase